MDYSLLAVDDLKTCPCIPTQFPVEFFRAQKRPQKFSLTQAQEHIRDSSIGNERGCTRACRMGGGVYLGEHATGTHGAATTTRHTLMQWITRHAFRDHFGISLCTRVGCK